MTQKSLTLALETYGMDDLSSDLTPETVQVQFSAETLAAIDSFVELLNSNDRIKSLSIDLGADGFVATFVNEDGDDTGLSGMLDLELFLDACNQGSHIRLVLSGCDTDVHDDNGDSFNASGEFFVNIPVADMRELLRTTPC